MATTSKTRNIPFGRPMIGEEERRAVLEVLSGPILTHGPHVHEFEQVFARFTKAPFAVATASCTAALHLAYLHLGIGPGDEVIVPTQSHVATAHAVEYCSARPVFVDSEPRTGNIDIDAIEASITERTRALSVVHYLGLPVDMDRVMAIARRHNLFVVEDCALAIGSYYKGTHAGLIGDVGCFSFYPVKHITTAEGGMLITRHADVAKSLSMQRAFGIDRNIVSQRKTPGDYDVERLGFNYRLNEIGAAMGLAQMQRVEVFLAKRHENDRALRNRLAEIDEVELLDSSRPGIESSHYCLPILLKDPLAAKRLDVMESLGKRGVGCSVYYPRPIPHMSYYRKKYGDSDATFPVAARISKCSIALPIGPHVEAEDIVYIAEQVKSAIAEVK
ncbi:MAG TPA: DegT/DnrJ/EryC1/StrS family aminotransferase [Planctomycetaceae bacterium]|nr:DegT/DnrJ/EryC1/StrS family aminotransferase [Planctomycetaceae bacterium]